MFGDELILFRRGLCDTQFHALVSANSQKILHLMYSGSGQRALEMYNSVNLPCYGTWEYFPRHGFDLKILITFFVLTAILIVTANGCFLTEFLSEKDKVRPYKVIVIVRLFDIVIN